MARRNRDGATSKSFVIETTRNESTETRMTRVLAAFRKVQKHNEIMFGRDPYNGGWNNIGGVVSCLALPPFASRDAAYYACLANDGIGKREAAAVLFRDGRKVRILVFGWAPE